ncbi:MAG: peptidylprolyl isomerase [Patulibacter sp.]
MRTTLTLLLIAAACGAAACGDDDTASTPSAASVAASATAAAPERGTADDGEVAVASCAQADAPKAKSADTPKPTGSLDPDKNYYAVLKTSCGTITIKLDQRNNPKTANAFATLVRAGYYDGLSFHRVVKGWVVQGGDPSGTGAGGPPWQVVEAPPKDAQYTRGTVAMAKTPTDPDGASGSQFFIVVGDDAGLPAQYAIAGHVKTGRAVVDAISDLAGDEPDGPPARPIVIESATLEVK